MKKLLYIVCSVILFNLLYQQCANPQSPTGGPKDSIPPTLLDVFPPTGTTNFNEQTITFQFSERIGADKLRQSLIITPKIDIKFKHLVKKDQLILKLESPFPDSTTYSLNFFNGVTDITEKNPAVNLVYAFSTGDYIDSLKVSGYIYDLLEEKEQKKFTVGLYPASDTLDYLAHNPLYFTTTNDSGIFRLTYLKAGSYRILAFNDDNSNLLLDPEKEDHGFLADTLTLLENIEDLQIPTIVQNIKPLQMTNSRASGQYFEVKYNKYISSYDIQPDSLHHNLIGEAKDAIRFYNPQQFSYNDSIPIIVTANDSLGNQVIDSIKMVFSESSRAPSKFSFTLNKPGNTILQNEQNFRLTFNKPITQVAEENMYFAVDSTFQYSPDSIQLQWNTNRTLLSLTTFLITDSLYANYYRALPLDTATTDSAAVSRKATQPRLTFKTDKAAFLSIESDTSKVSTATFSGKENTTTGVLKLIVETEHPSFIIQILSTGKKVVATIRNERTPTLQLKAGSYRIRVLIDNNGDGEWSLGNLLKNQEPEGIYLFPDELAIRENWIVEGIRLSF